MFNEIRELIQQSEMFNILEEFINQIIANPLSILPFLSASAVSTVIFKSKRIIDYYKFKKNNRFMTIKSFPPSIIEKIDEFDETKVAEKYRDEVVNFYEILKNNFSEEALNTFNNNINSADIIRKKLRKNKMGYYSRNNNITLGYKAKEDVLTHELLHLASALDDGDIFRCGFSAYSDNGVFGTSFNEGYTELLNRRYFHPESSASIAYEYMVKITKCMESIVGKDLMQESYFKCDFQSVCDKLLSYSNKDDIERFLKCCEYLFSLLGSNNNSMFDKNKVTELFNFVNETLISAYINKLEMEKNSNQDMVNGFMNDLPSMAIHNETKYMIDNNQLLLNALNKEKPLNM